MKSRATSWWGDVWCRFRQQRTSMVAAVILLAIILASAIAPLTALYNPTEQFRDDGLTELGAPRPPCAKFWLGTDGVGRDLLSRLIWGGRQSLAIGFAASGLIVVIALLVGGLAGYVGGLGDFLLMRFVDVAMSFPTFFMMLLLATMLRPGVWVVIVVISVFGWSYPARIFRSQMLSIKDKEFVTAARCLGIPGHLIFVRHLLPHLLPLVIVYTALNLPTTIFAEASLSFVGRGVTSPSPVVGKHDP